MEQNSLYLHMELPIFFKDLWGVDKALIFFLFQIFEFFQGFYILI
jgi:hypothetical protein